MSGTIFSVHAASVAREESRRATRMSEYLRAVVGAADPSHYSTLRSGRSDVMLSEVLDSTLARVERDLAGEPRVRADMYWTLGNAFRVFGKFDVAIRLLDSAQILHRQTLGDNSLEVARDVHFGALMQQEIGRSDLALRPLEDALARYRRLPAPPDTEVIDVLVSLGQVLGVGLQRREEGASMLREAESLELRRALPRWPLLGILQSALATTLMTGPDVAATDAAFGRAVASFRRDSARARGELAFVLLNWGTALGRRGDRVRAAALKRDGLRALEETYGPTHSLTAIFQQRLGDELIHLDSLEAARVLVDSALVVQESIAPRNYVELVNALRLRAAIARRSGHLEDAGQLLTRSRALLDSMGAAQTLPAIAVYTELSRWYEARRELLPARRALEQAYAIAVERLGASHVLTRTAIGDRAAFADRRGMSEESSALRRDSVAMTAAPAPSPVNPQTERR